ncbi:MAG: molybdenum cofactor guanylyltransferase MobA [Rubrivivax sp.]
MTTMATQDITGLVLAGGRGSRMGGVDKGLQLHLGRPLAQHALLRLQPQVGAVALNANRNLDAYAAMGVPVWPDPLPDHPGPLAGLLAGLVHAGTPWLVSVPCDTPNFPADLVARLAAAALAQDAEIVMPSTLEDGRVQPQPVFCLLRSTLRSSLQAYLQAGERKVERWTAQHRCVLLPFDDSAAFFNANTLAELQQLQPRQPRA